MTNYRLLLHSTLNDALAIRTPQTGEGGDVEGATFPTTPTDRGTSLIRFDRYLRFPLATTDENAGRIEFDYYPRSNYGVPPYTVLFNRGMTLILEVRRHIKLIAHTDRGTFTLDPPASVTSLWVARRAVTVAVEWENTSQDSLRLWINGARVGNPVPGGWKFLPAETPWLYVGCLDNTNQAWAEGTLDNLKTFSIIPDAPPPPPPEPDPENRSPIGSNIEIVRYWSQHWMFKDHFKYAGISGDGGKSFSSTGPGTWLDGRPLDLDANGWVRSLQVNQNAVSIWPTLGGGAMKLTHEGQGIFTLTGATGLTSPSPGVWTFNIAPALESTLRILSTNATNYMRNIKIFRQDQESTLDQVFHPTFLDRLRPFSVLRLKDLASIDQTTESAWANRPQVSHAVQSKWMGIALEYQIDLCNTLDAHPWFCIPHLANDDYVRNMATLIRDRLKSSLIPRIEWSNEVWNGVYQVAAYAQQQGTALNLSSDPNEARLRFQARRSTQCMKIFEEVFGTRPIIRVIASQTGQQWSHNRLLGFEDSRQHHDELSVAPYFGGVPQATAPQWESDVVSHDVNWLLDWMENTALPSAIQRMELSKQTANQYGIALTSYEGGQHLVTLPGSRGNQALLDKIFAANRHPRMYDLYTRYFNEWKRIGGQIFANFSFCGRFDQYGAFAVLERQDQDPATAPKYRAVTDFISANPRWW